MTQPCGRAGWILALLWVGFAFGEEFRVENEVFFDGRKEPGIRSTTIFHQGIVYDYLDQPQEITVFDAARGRFVLLDLTRKIRTELSTQRVAEFTDRLRKWAASQSDPFLRFLADPKFDIHYDDKTGQLTVASSWMTYRVNTIPAGNQTVSKEYRRFSDWYARMNTLLNPGTRPPEARLVLNASLEEHGRVPQTVLLEMRKEGLLQRKLVVRSEHQLFCRLVESDRDLIAQTDQFMAMFQVVDFAEYQRKMDN
jgi:hypothetical protein